MNAALLMLTEAWRYDQVEETDMTAEATAARAYQMYVEYLGECSMACCPLRINPFNGRLQQSDDGGLSWFDVEDGPWTESLYPPFSAMPAPRPEATEAEQKCAAAATAAYVLANLYQQTGNTLLNAVAETDWEYAGALGAMLQGFLMMIGAVAVQPFVAIASLLGIVGVKQQYVDNPLDADDEERLTCILLENATLEPSEAVTFDFQAVWDAIDLDSPKNGLVRFLLTMIGPDALNYAGAIDAGITPDCAACGCEAGEFTTTHALGWPELTIVTGYFFADVVHSVSEGYIDPVGYSWSWWVDVDLGEAHLIDWVDLDVNCNGIANAVWVYDTDDNVLGQTGRGVDRSVTRVNLTTPQVLSVVRLRGQATNFVTSTRFSHLYRATIHWTCP